VELLHATFVAHRYAAHLHDSWVVGMVDRGVVAFDLEGVSYRAPVDATFVIPPYAIHTGEPVTPMGYTYRAVYLDQEAIPGWFAEPLSTRPRHHVPVLNSHRAFARELSRLHDALVLPGRALEGGEAVAAVIGELARLASDDRGGLRQSHRSVDLAVAYIHAHWREDFTATELAEAAQASPFHLIRIFSQHVGIAPSAYRRALRVCAARRLLRTGRIPAEVAAECGFYDQSHLNRHFKAVLGVTPRQYVLGGG
jgi:AraC-like DNA-binding protein